MALEVFDFPLKLKDRPQTSRSYVMGPDSFRAMANLVDSNVLQLLLIGCDPADKARARVLMMKVEPLSENILKQFVMTSWNVISNEDTTGHDFNGHQFMHVEYSDDAGNTRFRLARNMDEEA